MLHAVEMFISLFPSSGSISPKRQAPTFGNAVLNRMEKNSCANNFHVCLSNWTLSSQYTFTIR